MISFLFFSSFLSSDFRIKIIGGKEVYPKNKYPFMVAIYKNGKLACGGTLYNQNTVITAAHCVYDNEVGNYTVLYNKHNLDLEEKSQTLKLVQKINHPNFNIDHNLVNDISIWKIDPVSNFTPVITLDSGAIANSNSTDLIVAGWGITDKGTVSPVLKETNIPIFNIDLCRQHYLNIININKESAICAGYPEGGRDSCAGDSGGPLFSVVNNGFVLVGIVSQGYRCAQPDLPGIYTKASYYTDFIAKYM